MKFEDYLTKECGWIVDDNYHLFVAVDSVSSFNEVMNSRLLDILKMQLRETPTEILEIDPMEET